MAGVDCEVGGSASEGAAVDSPVVAARAMSCVPYKAEMARRAP